ncbi:MAG: Na(+)-translocating NADH-quinone reductase subunit A [Pseudomonadales bacterium]
MRKIKKGLDLPISGSPAQEIDQAAAVTEVAVVGTDFPGLKPTMEVAEGDTVVKGQLLFTDKKNPGVRYTAPASGKVAAVNRGKKRVFQSLVIEVSGAEETEFSMPNLDSCDRAAVVDALVESGEWVAFKNRPFGKVPAIDSTPNHIFVSAMDTRPLAADPAQFINAHSDAFKNGLKVLTKLTEGTVYLCSEPDANIPGGDVAGVQTEHFTGVHPAGLVGTHIHFLAPVSQEKSVWSIAYQDVIAIGSLFATGKLFSERVVALCGPGVAKPRLVKTVTGANLEQLLKDEVSAENQRVISGSVLDGRTAVGPVAYLGRFHNQVSVLTEGREREFMGFVMPGAKKFSLTRLFISSLLGNKGVEITTSTGGSHRAMVPLGGFEEMMPLDILPTQLLRALIVKDVDAAIELGCLELDEEDLALCTFACTGKYEYGPYLREMLDRIEAEG